MNCSQVIGRLDRFLDGELEMDENVEVVRHVEVCAACASVVEGERLLFTEIRSQAAGPPAPSGLRDRIAAELGKTRPASRPWPFARALVPAAAAAVLVALFVTFFTQPLEAETMARRAVAWHDGGRAQAVALTSAPELATFYSSTGRKACIHEKMVNAGMKYAYKAASVESTGPSGNITCWWSAACPVSGMRMSHACFPAPAGFEKMLGPGQRKYLETGGRGVIMNIHDGFV